MISEPTKVQQVYRTLDPWQASWLHLLGVGLLKTRILPDGRPEYTFDNDGDRAWQAGLEFRTKGSAVAPLLDYRESYRHIQFYARQAREDQHHDDRTDN